MLSLCAVGCANRNPDPSLSTCEPPPFSDSGQAPLSDRWWTSFGDPALDEQVAIALDDSFTLAVALQRVCTARALARREASDLFPDVDGVAATRGDFQTDGADGWDFALGIDTSYQLDLWGQISSRVDAERLRASATYADYRAVALTLAADIARTWYSLIEAHAQLELLDEQIQTNLTGLELQEARFGLGQIRSADVLRQRALVESTREQAIVVRSRVELLEHQLALLQGHPPQGASYDPGTILPDLPPLPATGLPSDLLNRRPDVRRDFLAVRAADRDLAAAISSQYPRMNLFGSLSTAAANPEDLFREWFLSIGSQLVTPLIDGGQRRAEVARTASLVRQRFNEYGETMLIAFREVEDGLAQERYQLQRIQTLEEQVKHTKQASIQLREQYYIGDSDYLDVLSSITQEQRLQRETLSARLDLILVRIGLYLALAGDFENQPRIVLEDFPVSDMPGGQLLDENSLDAPFLLDPELESDPQQEAPPELELQPVSEPISNEPTATEKFVPDEALPPPVEPEASRRGPKPVLNAAFLLDDSDTTVAEEPTTGGIRR